MKEIKKMITERMFPLGAIKLNPKSPFQWASGNYMPIYNDNRLLTGDPDGRDLVLDGFEAMVEEHDLTFDFVIGVATAGIASAAVFAHYNSANFGYVRDKPKAHGLKNRIEGIDEHGFGGKRVLVIEDLVSFGGSSADAVQAVRDMGGVVDACLCIFSYGLDEASAVFAGSRPYNKEGKTLSQPCSLFSLLSYDEIINYAEKKKKFTAGEIAMLRAWREDPLQWQYEHGFAHA